MQVRPLSEQDLKHVLLATSKLWYEAKGERFFITGGTGFFGLWLLESFAFINDAMNLGMSAVVLTRDPVSFALKTPHLCRRNDIQLIKGDIRDFKSPNGEFKYLIHAAAETSAQINNNNPQLVIDTIINGTTHVLNFAKKSGARKILFTSSGAVYGKQPEMITHLNEDYLGAPNQLYTDSTYANAKRIAEHVALLASTKNGMDIRIARCFAFVGPHLPLDEHFAIGNFIKNVIDGKDLIITGDGSPYRSYLYASDLVIWLWSILFKGHSMKPYNGGYDYALTISDIAEHVVKISARKSALRRLTVNLKSGEISRYVPDIKRAQQELGLRVSVDLPEALIRTIEWNKSMMQI